MAGRDEESHRVMAAAMHYVKTGDRSALEGFPLAILQIANYQLGGRDEGSGYRNAIKDRIAELQKANAKSDVVKIEPSFFGIKININEAWRRIRRWVSCKKS